MFRIATVADATDVREILGFYIKNSAAIWRYEIMDLAFFENMIKNHQIQQRPFWVAEQNNKLIGYSCLSEFRAGEGYWPCAEDSVYVHPEYLHLGVGRQLMQLIIDQGRAAGLKAIVAAIDAENTSSIRFHEKFGFKICGTMDHIGWKNDSWRSLAWMQLDLA